MKHLFHKQKQQISIRKQLSQFSLLVLVVVIMLLLFYNILNFYTVERYNNAFNNYRDLSAFYTSLESADSSIKDYLYTNSEESLQEYERHIEQSVDSLETLKQDMQNEYAWRMDLLRNMLDSYVLEAQATCIIFQSKDDAYMNQYTRLLSTSSLISDTSDTYYEILIEQMETQNEMFTQLKIVTISLSFLLACVVILWLLYFSYRILFLITRPLDEIVQNINRVKCGEYDLSAISNTGIEMHNLCNALDEMAVAVKNDIVIMKANAELEKRLLETANDNLKKDELLAQSEVKMLQNQINPHFLFNTLNMTYKLALQEGAPRCSEMIERTSALLRYGLDKQNKLSDLQSEITAIENYIVIQEKRLGERVRFELHVDEGIPNVSIPGMIVQPLIENALKHGLKDCMEEGEIITSFLYDEHHVFIQVSDNGVGVESEQLEEMMLSNFHDIQGNHLGLYNVAKRLEMFYQDRVDISINSATDCGFEFVIKIEV